MEILVCMKSVPDERGEIRLDPESGKMDLSLAEKKENEFDAYALELALRTKEVYGGRVSVLTVGTEEDSICIRNALALGADTAFLIREDLAGEKDAAEIAQILSDGIPEMEKRQEKPFDLILTGKESTDYGSGLVGGILAEKRKLPYLSNIIEIKTEGDILRVKKELDQGYQFYEVEMPALLSVAKGELELRYPNIMKRLASRKTEIPEIIPERAEREKRLEYLDLKEVTKKKKGRKIKEADSKKAVDELIRQLAADRDLLLFGDRDEKAEKELGAFGVGRIYFAECRGEEGEEEDEEEILQALSQLGAEYDLILLSADRRGKSLTAQLGERLGAAAVNDALEVWLEEGSIYVKIPLYAGRFYQRVRLLKEKAVISIRPGSYDKPKEKKGESAEKRSEIIGEKINLSGEKDGRIRLLKTVKEKLTEIDLKEAEIIVSGGRGMGSKENYERLCGGLAELLGAALGASRSAVNQGWIGREHQVGQTGNLVKPKLYIACGISGAPQHLAGMRDSNYILAINQDEEAKIFDIANIALVGDVNQIIPLLIEEIKKKKQL